MKYPKVEYLYQNPPAGKVAKYTLLLLAMGVLGSQCTLGLVKPLIGLKIGGRL